MRRPSDRATADGGRTSSTVVNSSTSSSRQRGAAKRATTRRDNMTYTQSLEERGGQPLGQQDNACFRKRKSQLNYMDIRKIMDKRSVQQKKGLLTDAQNGRTNAVRRISIRQQLTGKSRQWRRSSINTTCHHSGKFLHSEKTDPFEFWYVKWEAVQVGRLGN